jgi:hypothetical protein
LFLLITIPWLTSCARRSASPQQTLSTAAPPSKLRAVFDPAPVIVNHHLKATIRTYGPKNWYVATTGTAQVREWTLPHNAPPPSSRFGYGIDDVHKLLFDSVTFPTGDSATTVELSRSGVDIDLRPFNGLNSVRLRVTVMAGANHPQDWTTCDSLVVFSKWLPIPSGKR